MTWGAREKKLKKYSNVRYIILGRVNDCTPNAGVCNCEISTDSSCLNPNIEKSTAAGIAAVQSPMCGLAMAGGAASRVLLFFVRDGRLWHIVKC